LVLQGEPPLGAALAPEADGVGVEFDPGAGRDVGEQGLLVQQHDQAGALPEVRRGGTPADEVLGLSQKLVREAGAVERCRAGYGDGPLPAGQRWSMNDPPSP
jgi:hypothetical protein